MSEYECHVDGCGESFDSKKSRGGHFTKGHDEEIVKKTMLDRLSELENRPRKQDLSDEIGISRKAFKRRFGSCNEAYRLVGFEPGYPTGENSHLYAGGDTHFTCKNCGERKEKIKPSKDRKFCSIKCKGEHYSGDDNPKWVERVSDECKYCGEKISYLESQGGEYCDIDCYYDDLSSGAEDSYGPNWYPQRRKCLERDNATCFVCNSGENIHVHHIKPRSQFMDEMGSIPPEANELDNLICVCQCCHGSVEGKFTEKSADELKSMDLSDVASYGES